MFNAKTAHTVFGAAGNIMSFLLYISQIPAFFWIMKKKTAEGYKPDPYLATVLRCLLWVFYGMPFIHPGSFNLIVPVNSVGLVLELIYVAIFFIYSKNNERTKIIYVLAAEFLFFSAVVPIAIFVFHNTKRRALFVGILCDIFSTITHYYPLTIMMKVIETKSVKYMPILLSLANFLNGSFWSVCALTKLDVFVLTTHGIGAISGAVQLILYAYYYRSTPKDDQDHDHDGDEKVPKPRHEVQFSVTITAEPSERA